MKVGLGITRLVLISGLFVIVISIMGDIVKIWLLRRLVVVFFVDVFIIITFVKKLLFLMIVIFSMNKSGHWVLLSISLIIGFILKIIIHAY